MLAPDLLEWLGLMASLPFRLLAVFFCVLTVAYVYFDAERRSRSKLFATALGAAVWFGSWPISFFAYLACTVILDRRAAIDSSHPATADLRLAPQDEISHAKREAPDKNHPADGLVS